MFTKIDKAIAALLGSALTIAAAFGLNLDIDPEVVGGIGTAITTIIVYLVPNKQ